MESISKGEQAVSLNAFDQSYEDQGEGISTIIFLHGFPFDKTMWKGQMEFFKKKYRVVACDIRGFGNSKAEKIPLSIDLFSEDLIAFMNKLNIDKAVICGLSMGGYIALNTIKRFPDRVQTLILCDTQCIADSEEAKQKRLKAIDEIILEGTTAFNERFITSIFHPDSLIQKKDVVEDLKKIVAANSQHIIISGLKALSERNETCDILDEIKVPTLIICGKDDVVTPLAQSEYMHTHISGSVLKVIEQAGHVSNLEQADEFNMIMSDFLDLQK